MEGTAKEVFSNPLCEEYHTRLPQCTKIAGELKNMGIDMEGTPVTVEETVNKIKAVMENKMKEMEKWRL